MAPVIYFWKDELQRVRLLNTEGEQKRAAHNPSIEIRILLSKQDFFTWTKSVEEVLLAIPETTTLIFWINEIWKVPTYEDELCTSNLDIVCVNKTSQNQIEKVSSDKHKYPSLCAPFIFIPAYNESYVSTFVYV